MTAVVLYLALGLATGVLALLMALITLIDFRHFIIPDVLSLPAVPLGIIATGVPQYPCNQAIQLAICKYCIPVIITQVHTKKVICFIISPGF